MAQPSANREPTMEEILASIRRIIESNDGAPTADTQMADTQAEDDAPHRGMPAESPVSEEESMPVVEPDSQPRASLAAVAERPLAAPPRPTPPLGGSRVNDSRPVSLADVAARVRASGAAGSLAAARGTSVAPPLATRGNAAVRVEPRFEYSPDEQTSEDDRPDEDPVREAEEPTGQMAANDAGVAAQAAKAEPRPDDAASRADGEPGLEMSLHEVLAAAVEPASDEAPAMPAAEQEEPSVRPGQMKPGTQLMSPGAGAKVAAAFGDLSDVFNGDPRRSFDEMAEEMLRPMLQQWLDDNLPTLVERLVREEIERVARGNRR